MHKNDSIKKELILPDAIESLKSRWSGNIIFARMFKLWRYRYFVIASGIGVILSINSFFWGISLIFIVFLLDYLILRSRAKEKAQLQLDDLKKLVSDGFYESDKHREDSYELDFGNNKILDGNPANTLRKALISKIAKKYFRPNYRILDAGCKGGEMCAALSNKSFSIFGIDFNHSALKNFVKRFKGSGIQGNILQLPFKDSKFDTVLCTEVIEHLFNPIQGLTEIAKVMNPKGLLILSTDNRNRIRLLDILNPLIILERIIGLSFSKVLIPKNIIWKWKDKFTIYHSEYSRTELVSLVKTTGKYEIVSYFSFFFLPDLYKIIGRIYPNLNQKDYKKVVLPIENILAKIPIIKWLGDHWIMILRKI